MNFHILETSPIKKVRQLDKVGVLFIKYHSILHNQCPISELSGHYYNRNKTQYS